MSTPNDGGPAFPRTGFWSSETQGFDCEPKEGMTLRDYFAAKAMGAYLSMDKTSASISRDIITSLDMAGSCYEWADLMIIARDRKEQA